MIHCFSSVITSRVCIYLAVIGYVNFDNLSKVLHFLQYKREEVLKGFLWRELLVSVDLASFSTETSRHAVSPSPQVRRETPRGKLPVCPLNVPGHSECADGCLLLRKAGDGGLKQACCWEVAQGELLVDCNQPFLPEFVRQSMHEYFP